MSQLQKLADAIRAKDGSTDGMTIDEMPEKIGELGKNKSDLQVLYGSFMGDGSKTFVIPEEAIGKVRMFFLSLKDYKTFETGCIHMAHYIYFYNFLEFDSPNISAGVIKLGSSSPQDGGTITLSEDGRTFSFAETELANKEYNYILYMTPELPVYSAGSN